MRKIIIIFFLLIYGINANVFAQTKAGLLDFADLVEPLLPAVVNISTTQKTTAGSPQLNAFPGGQPFDDLNELFERFGFPTPPDFPGLEKREKHAFSLGSGFIISPEGYIVTNHHVISKADEITVKFNDEREVKAKLVGSDAKTDLALLKVETNKPLHYVKFADSDELRAGNWVIAIGNPFGLGGTVTAGIVSARERDINASGIVDNFIQTDASINSGNSGGPMFNMNGEVVGINTAILTPSMGNVGIGFATPSNIAKPILEQIKQTGKVRRSWLGIIIQPIDDEVAESLGLKELKGVLIAEITSNSPAEKAGLLPGDIILSFDGKDITTMRKLPRLAAEAPIGHKAVIKYMRKGKEQTTEVTLTEMPAEINEGAFKQNNLNQPDLNNQDAVEIYGVVLNKITPEIRSKFAINPKVNGALVTKVNRKSEWLRRGILVGDIITGVNQDTKIASLSELINAIEMAQKEGRKSILLRIHRAGNTLFIAVPLAK